VVRIGLADTYDLGQEFFRWEIATAVAGSILGIHPFNQPDVEASKIATRNLTSEYEKTNPCQPKSPFSKTKCEALTDAKNAADLAKAAGADQTLAGYLKAHLGRLKPGDYFALLGYLEMNEANRRQLQTIRHADATRST